MALDKLVDSTQLDASLTYEAGKLRAKLGSSAQLDFDLANGKGFGDYIDAIPTGGGGATVVASGTAQGSGTYDMEIPIGTKMPIRNFVIALWAENNTEFTYDSSKRQLYGSEVVVDGDVGYMGFLNREPGAARDVYEAKSSKAYTVNNSGTISTVDYNPMCGWLFGVFGNNKYGEALYQFFMYKYDDHCTFYVNRSNSFFVFPSAVTYNYKVIYYGNDPVNDFLEVS